MANPPKVLVTGATGGLGKALVTALLAKGFSVRATGRRPGDGLLSQGADFRSCDLTQDPIPPLTDGVDGVFHCAALSSPWGTDDAFLKINVDATSALLASAKRSGCRRFVFVSSPSVYARESDQLDLTERDAIATTPLNAYARTKAAAEALVTQASSDEMPCVALRPRAIIGPDDDVLLPRLLRLLNRNRFPLVNGGSALIEPTDVRDVVATLITAYDRAPCLSGEVINISGGQSVSVHSMVSQLAQTLGKSMHFIDLPYGALRPLAALGEYACARLPGRPEPPLTVYTLAALSFSQTFNLAKAKAVLDYTPRYNAIDTARQLTRSLHGR